MEKFSPELHTLIIDYLDAIAIVRFQQTCKRFHSLVTENSEQVWRRCLQRQTADNGLFRPSYQDLIGPSALKRACTGSRRLIRAFDAISNDPDNEGKVITRTSLTLPQIPGPSAEDRSGRIEGMVLIPGGRFLLTAEKNWLCMWDLDSCVQIDNENSQPTLVLQHRLATDYLCLANVNVIDNTKIRILLYLDEPTDPPSGFRCEILEIRPCENATFSLEKLGMIHIFNYFREGGSIILEDMAVICLQLPDGPHLIVVWDFKRSLYCEIKAYGAGTVFTDHKHIFYASAKGVYVFELREFQPIQNARICIEESPQSGALRYTTPTSVHFHDDPNFDSIIPKVHHFSSEDPLVYWTSMQVKRVTYLRQYHFFFDALDPQASKLKLVESSKSTSRHTSLFATQFYRCDDRPAILWEGAGSGLPSLSLSPPVVQATVNDTTAETEFNVFPLEMDAHHESYRRKIDLCPSSGRAVRFWRHMSDDEAYIEMYDFH